MKKNGFCFARAAKACAALCLALVLPADCVRAASYRVPPDATLVRQAELAVRGRALDALPSRLPTGGIVTDVRLGIETVLLGETSEPVVTVRLPGGSLDGAIERYPGTGDLLPGERVVVLLRRAGDGSWRLVHHALGKFHVGRTESFEDLAFRDGLSAARAVGPDGRPHLERIRSLSAFEGFIRAVAAGDDPPEDYFRDSWSAAPELAPSFSLLEVGGGYYARWREFEQDQPISMTADSTGPQGNGCADFPSAVASGVTAWNADPDSRILLLHGGLDPAIGAKCFQQLSNQINFDDPCSEMSNLAGCSGTLAIGGFSATDASRTPACPDKGNPLFLPIVEGRIMVNNGVGNCLSCCDFQDMIAHETGHVLGFDHSSVSSALMAPYIVHARCGELQSDDRAAARCVYPADPGPPFCSPPVVDHLVVREPSPAIVKVRVYGGPFLPTDVVQIDSGSGFRDAPVTVYKSAGKLLAKKLAGMFPNRSTVQVRVRRGADCVTASLPASR